MKKQVLYGAVIGLLGIFIYLSGFYKRPFIQSTPPQAIQQYYNNWLQEQEETMWGLLKQYHITKTDYDRYKKKSEKNYIQYLQQLNSSKRPGPALSQQTLKLVDRVFSDFNVSQDILVKSYISQGISCACAHDTTLFIDEALLGQLPYKAQLFVVAHELSHALFKDQELGYILFNLFPHYEANSPSEHPLNIIHRFQELRADMNAAVKSLDYAQGSIELCKEYLKQCGPGKGVTHPTIPDRIKENQKILALYQPGNISPIT